MLALPEKCIQRLARAGARRRRRATRHNHNRHRRLRPKKRPPLVTIWAGLPEIRPPGEKARKRKAHQAKASLGDARGRPVTPNGKE